MSLDRVFEIDVPAVPIPPTWVFAYATRMSDFDSPSIERILRPATEMKRHRVEIRLTTGESRTHVEHHPRPDTAVGGMKHGIKRILHRREPVIDLGRTFALDMRFSFMGNYAHLIHDVLGPLRLIERTFAEDGSLAPANIHVILPKKAPPIALKVLDFAGVPTVCTDGAVRGNLVTITQELNVALLPNLASQPFEPWWKPTPERVFVSRRGARSLLNEQHVTDFLAREGFERVYMEDLPIAQQWTMLGNAREIVGIHGAGLSSLGFCTHRPIEEGPRFRLVELFSAGFSSSCFRDYAAVLSGSWVGVRGKITPEIVRDLDVLGNSRAHDNASFEVDIESLAEALDHSRRAAPPADR